MSNQIEVYSSLNPPPGPVIDYGDEPGADQSFKDDCNINVIMERAARGAEMIDPVVMNGKVGQYLDLSNAPEDYHHAQNIILDTQERFNAFPARIRNRFENDPGLMLEFLADPSNKDEAIELGLIEKAPSEPPVPAPAAPVVPPATPA